MLLSIITGTYQRLSYLQAMVESARKSMPKGIDYEFVVADGGSTDGSLEWMREQADIKLIEQGELLGAIKAFNAAGAAATGDFLIVSNDDVVFVDYTIAKAIAFMQDNPDVGAGCFEQDRAGKDWHCESMPIYYPGEKDARWEPYMQVGIIPRWLWDKCGGWGNWGGRTYGGDNYLSAKVYESGYRVVKIEGCRIHDKTPNDELRRINNDKRNPDQNLWKTFPNGFTVSNTPLYPNPLVDIGKRVLYAPIIEAGHTIQKAQKKGLREALKALGPVWEVDYVYGKESVVEASEAWKPHIAILQFHDASACTYEDGKRIRAACETVITWIGDCWPQQQMDPQYLSLLHMFDLHGCVNAALLPAYKEAGINAVYFQNAFEPEILNGES